jgi:hypothetical protein
MLSALSYQLSAKTTTIATAEQRGGGVSSYLFAVG